MGVSITGSTAKSGMSTTCVTARTTTHNGGRSERRIPRKLANVIATGTASMILLPVRESGMGASSKKTKQLCGEHRTAGVTSAGKN